MPELPEVEIVTNTISSKILNKKLVSIKALRRNIRYDLPKSLETVSGKISNIFRRAKYIVMEVEESNVFILIHLGMTGKLVYLDQVPENFGKHDHVIFIFNDKSALAFNDYRRFGMVDVADDALNNKYLSKLGIEPLSSDFSAQYLFNLAKQRSISIKQFIMDNQVVVGVGNIYACEALFYANISPHRPCNTIFLVDYAKLVCSIKKVLQQGIESGGSSIKDFVNINGESGKFQNNFKVYGRANQNCAICSHTIIRIKQSGRSSFYCPECQN